MRSPLHLVLAAALCTGGVALPSAAQANAQDPEQLYNEGQADYANGLFESAVTKMSEAYELSGDPLMLYYIAQGYRDWYKESKKVEHLREAKVIFEKFIVALQADPTLGDPADVKPKIEELEELITAAEAAEAAANEPEPEPEPAPEPAVDPGKKTKTAGFVLLGIGGATLLGGAGVGIAFGVKALGFKADISGLRTDFRDQGCDSEALTPGTCTTLNNDIDSTLASGKQANLITGVGWGIAGLGVALAVTGGVLYAKGKRKTDVWKAEQARIRVLPTWGGLAIMGSF